MNHPVSPEVGIDGASAETPQGDTTPELMFGLAPVDHIEKVFIDTFLEGFTGQDTSESNK